MKKYFLLRNANVRRDVPASQIASYRSEVISEMKKLGATEQEFLHLHEETILNSIQNKRKPEDVAWAILQ